MTYEQVRSLVNELNRAVLAAPSTEGAKCHVCGKPATGVCPEDAGPAGSHGAPLCDTCRCSCGGNPLNPTSTVNAVVEQTPVAWRYRYKGERGEEGDWKYVEKADDCNPLPEYEREPLYAISHGKQQA